MASQIEYTASVLKQLKKLDKHVAKDIMDYLEKDIAPLDDPTTRGESLTNSLVGLHRYRIGDFRAICHIENGTLTILVLRISHRRDVYNLDQNQFAVEAQIEIQELQRRQQEALASASSPDQAQSEAE